MQLQSLEGAARRWPPPGRRLLPVFSHLQVWRDYNQDGVQDDNEVSTLAQLGINVIDYANGTFTKDGVLRLASAVDLNAERDGVITSVVNGGVVVTHQSGASQELASQVGDLTGKGQRQTSADGQNVQFTPGRNFSGGGQFSYRVQDGQGRIAEGVAEINIAHINQAPQITVEHNTVEVGVFDNGNFFWADPNLVQTVAVDDPYSGHVTVSDPDDDGFAYQIVNGNAAIDQNGNWSYAPRSFDGQLQVFDVRVTDPHGASATLRVVADAQRFGSQPSFGEGAPGYWNDVPPTGDGDDGDGGDGGGDGPR